MYINTNINIYNTRKLTFILFFFKKKKKKKKKKKTIIFKDL